MPFSATRDLWLVLKARDEASRAMGAFSRDIRLVGDSVRMANLQAARSALSNQLAMQKLTGASQQDIIATQGRIAAIDREIGMMKTSRAEMEETRVAAQRMSSALQGVAGMATAVGTGLTAAGVFGVMGLKKLVDASVEYERQSMLTATQVDKFSTSLQDIEQIGFRVAKAVGVPFEQIQPALFDIFSSMEIGASDAEKLLTIFSKAAVAGQTDIQNASKATIGILNAFHLPLDDINHLMDVQFLLVKEGIGSYEDWTSRIGLVTPSAVRAGQSVDMMAAALAASTRMGIAAAQSGAAVARAFDAISNPAAITAMKEMGVNVVDAKGNFRSMIDILYDLRKALSGLPEAKQVEKIVNIFKGAGGTIQARRFLQNMIMTPGNLELFQNIFNQMSDSTGTFEQAYSMMADTTATKTQLIANKWDMLKVSAGNALTPTFLSIMNLLGSLFDKFNNLSPTTQKTIMKILALAAAGSILLGIILLIVGTIAALGAAIAVAGAGVLVIAGGFLALVAAIIGFSVAIAVAWKKSQEFRDIIMNLYDSMMSFWKDVIVPFARDAKDAFEKYILPALIKLHDVFVSKVMPVISEIISKFREDFIPVAKEVTSWVKDRLTDAFKLIGDAITRYVIPAIEMITSFYKQHKQTIDEVIKAIAIFSAVLLGIAAIVVGVLMVALGGPLVAIVMGFVVAISAVIFIIVKAIEIIKNIINWFKHFGEHMAWLGDKVKGIWDYIVGLFDSAIAYLIGLWQAFWKTSIGQFLLSVFNVITGVIDIFWQITVGLFNTGVAAVEALWNFIWDAVIVKIIAAWGFIINVLTVAWDFIVKVATTVWGAIVGFFVSVWDNIWNTISPAVNKIVDLIKTGFQTAKDFIMGIFDDIKGFFDKAKDWLFGSGQKVVQGLLDGITSKLNELGDKLHEIAQKIKDFFPHSPAKKGPLSGKGGMYYAGQNIVNQLQDGINSKLTVAGYSASLVANAAGESATGLAASNMSKNYTQTINVNTQEINPTRHAMELGMLLAGSK